MTANASRVRAWCARSASPRYPMVLAALGVAMSVATGRAAVPNPAVTGPITAVCSPMCPSPPGPANGIHIPDAFDGGSNLQEFIDADYVEEEFFFEGTATAFERDPGAPGMGLDGILDRATEHDDRAGGVQEPRARQPAGRPHEVQRHRGSRVVQRDGRNRSPARLRLLPHAAAPRGRHLRRGERPGGRDQRRRPGRVRAQVLGPGALRIAGPSRRQLLLRHLLPGRAGDPQSDGPEPDPERLPHHRA